ILAMVGNNSFQAYPDARWAAPVPQLWRDWLLDAFWRDGRVSELSASTDGLQANVELSGMLRALHNEYVGGRGVAVIQYDARLVNTATRQIISSRRFEAREPVAGTSAAQLVTALGIAANRVATEVIAWTVAEN
ncbi:MAG: ABC-type transport auxiliary lipoprotein family protein, partial [Gammaproteobacteria bacterium]|nr:ABC-type transport auxiliary lipoprotein family protein [Gammaproteobacteria bacterium]